jgi:hypothetical protein
MRCSFVACGGHQKCRQQPIYRFGLSVFTPLLYPFVWCVLPTLAGEGALGHQAQILCIHAYKFISNQYYSNGIASSSPPLYKSRLYRMRTLLQSVLAFLPLLSCCFLITLLRLHSYLHQAQAVTARTSKVKTQ